MSGSGDRIAPMPSEEFEGTEQQVSAAVRKLQIEARGKKKFSLDHLHRGGLIQQVRHNQGLSRLDLAREAGVNPVWLGLVEGGILPAILLPEDEEAISKVEKFLNL